MCTFIVSVCTIPAEISPQALHLGAASIVAAINRSFEEKLLVPLLNKGDVPLGLFLKPTTSHILGASPHSPISKASPETFCKNLQPAPQKMHFFSIPNI
jgi:hypothetical protein